MKMKRERRVSVESDDSEICHICSDSATGRHYGAIACNGCKGFFRRTIRRGYRYKCRFESHCRIDKHNRAICRFCRFMKCLNAGMKEDQVQNERDVIGKRQKPEEKKLSVEEQSTESATIPTVNVEYENLLSSLLRAESKIQSLRDTVIKQIGNVEYTTNKNEGLFDMSTATLNDVLRSMHSQLLLVIEWAKTLPVFTQLSPEDQRILLKNFAGQHVTLCVAYRSKETSDVLKLINDRYIPRASTATHMREQVDGFYLPDCEKVMDQLVAPMRFLKMDDTEFVALKACILFNPVVKGLSARASQLILENRRKIFGALEYYIRTNKPLELTRLGDLTFFILTPLAVLAQTISEDVMFTKVSGVARIDVLMEDLILADSDYHPMRNGFYSAQRTPERNVPSTSNEGKEIYSVEPTPVVSEEVVNQRQQYCTPPTQTDQWNPQYANYPSTSTSGSMQWTGTPVQYPATQYQ